MSLRIAIDARKLADFGIGSYLRGLLAGLAALEDDSRYLLLAPPAAAELLPDLPARFEWIDERAPHYSAAELVAISRQARRLGADLLHCPHYVVPFGPPCPVVVTIHDAIHLTHPETLPRPRALAFAYAKLMLARAARVAARVIAVSAAAADELGAELRIAPGKLVVVPNGVDARFGPERPAPPTSALADTATLILPASETKKPVEGAVRQPSLPSRVEAVDGARDGGSPAAERGPGGGAPEPRSGPLLFVGNPKPHKNLHRLLEAYSRLVRARPAAAVPPLVLAGGGREPRDEAALRARVRALGLEQRVRFAGFVSDALLADLYREASMLVFPTLAEGFGLPIVEAMACGTPVVVSDLPVHREIAGEAGERVDPRDPDSIAAGIARLLDDPQLAERRRSAGLLLAARFSWRTTARRTRAVYDAVLADDGRRRSRVGR